MSKEEKPDESIVISELRGIIDQQKNLIEIMSKQIDSLLKSAKEEKPVEVKKATKEVIQINLKGKKHFCATPQEKDIFVRAHPGKIESFNIELPDYVADEYLKRDKEHFEEKEQKDG